MSKTTSMNVPVTGNEEAVRKPASKTKKALPSASKKTDNTPDKFSTADKAMYSRLVKGINEELSKVEKSYLVMAFKVHHVYVQNLFKIDGFKNIYEWSAKKFRLARGTTNNYINICKTFGKIEKDGTCKELLPQYAVFSSSQLIVMLSMDEMTRELISSDMTVKQIKEKKKESGKGGADNSDDSVSDVSDISDDTKDAKILDNLLCIMQLKNVADFTEQNLATIHSVFNEFVNTHSDLSPTISVDIRWTAK